MLTLLGADLARPWRLLAYGDPNVDLVFGVERVPRADQKALGRRLGSFAGGTVANAGCAASALGCATQAFGRVGADAEGEFLVGEYRRFGVDTARVRRVAGTPSACAMVMLEPWGEKALVYAPMAGSPFDPPALADALAAATLLYAMPYDIDEFTALHALARAAGSVLALDVETAMAPARGDIERLLALADIVFMNEATYRHAFAADPDPQRLHALLALGPRILVVTRGASGAMAAAAGDVRSHAAFRADAVDATGAGDCFNGAFLAALCEGADLHGCLRFACAAASFAVARFGARSGMPSRAQVDALLAPRRAVS